MAQHFIDVKILRMKRLIVELLIDSVIEHYKGSNHLSSI